MDVIVVSPVSMGTDIGKIRQGAAASESGKDLRPVYTGAPVLRKGEKEVAGGRRTLC